MSPSDKKSIRLSIRHQRETLGSREVLRCSKAVVRHICRTKVVRHARRIGVYYPFRNEIDLLLLLQQPVMQGKTFYLPVIGSLRFEPLHFAPFHTKTRLIANRFHIPEPDVAVGKMCRASRLDVLFVPLVAFDGCGHRLGFGAGFYDRTLGYLRRRRFWIKPRLFGVGFGFQQVDSIAADPWDINLPAVVTESGVIQTGEA